MNYTQNHHLPQWEKDDRIMMEDFNRMCRDMEAGLDEGLAGVDSARADAARDSARAQATAESALAKANDAYCPDFKPYAVGQYKGNGETTTVTLGFRPRFVIISGLFRTGNGDPTGFSFLSEIHSPSSAFELLEDGFLVKKTTRQDPDWGEVETHPFLNSENRNYVYIAFR